MPLSGINSDHRTRLTDQLHHHIRNSPSMSGDMHQPSRIRQHHRTIVTSCSHHDRPGIPQHRVDRGSAASQPMRIRP
jgi:hypothetical protein